MNPADLHPSLRQSLFIAGTDTGVGKTWVATRLIGALAAAGHRVAGMKPVAAGAGRTSHGWRNDDALELIAAANVRLPYELVNPVCLARPTSPHLAAQEAGIVIDPGMIEAAFHQIQQRSELVIVEGAGGWFTPIGPAPAGEPGLTMQEVARRLGLPVVLVVGIRLGSLNHALLTTQAIRQAGLPLAGWIANPVDPGFADTAQYVESLSRRLPGPLLWTAPRVILPRQ